MPVIDMKLEELEQYTGSSPLPEDFDSFWEKALDEAASVDTDCLWKDADFDTPVATCRHLYFTGTGGARIHIKVLLPAEIDGPIPALLNFHGYSGASAQWSEYLAWAASGVAVFAMDCRGQGGLSQNRMTGSGPTLYGDIVRGLDGPAEDLYYRSIYQDIFILTQIVRAMPEINPERIGAYGGSQGGALALVCAALEPRISCLAPSYPFLSDFKRVWDMDLAKAAYVGLSDYFRRFDPLHRRESEIFRRLGYIDVVNLAPRIRGRVLFAATLMDEICPPSTQFAVYNRLTCDKDMMLFPDYGHERLPLFGDECYQFLRRELLR